MSDPDGRSRTPDSPKGDKKARQTTSWLRYSHLGLQFAVTLLLCVLAGRWLETKFGWAPWGTVLGSLFGIVASMYSVVKDAGAVK